jgi:hypothetical protein
MIKRASGLRLPPESLQCLTILLEIFGKNFSATKRPRRMSSAFVDHTHAPAAELLNNPISAKWFARAKDDRSAGGSLAMPGGSLRGCQNLNRDRRKTEMSVH